MSTKVPGVTPTERYLYLLSRRAFLRLWSYSGIYRDQGTRARGGEGAELCDLLVVCDPHVLIFSDKNCEFSDEPDRELAWRRWYTNAVARSAKQVFGAERWLREHPTRLFLDRGCTQPIPIPLPDLSGAQFHRIVVAHDRTGRRAAATGGSGTLMLDPRLQGDDHLLPSAAGGHPFAIGHVNPSKGFVHVFDEITLELVLRSLDTVTDFANYLARKEAVLRSGRLGALGEEELLGFYLSKVNDQGEHDFVLPPADQPVVLAEGHWTGLMGQPGFERKALADEISYLWDEIIEAVAGHALDGTLYQSADPAVVSHERALREMAREPRLRRRLLSRALRDLILAPGDRRRRIRTVFPGKPNEPHYVLMTVKQPLVMPAKGEHEDYRQYRRSLLTDYCVGVLAAYPKAHTVVGLATESDDSHGTSFDLAFIERKNFTEDDLQMARRISDEEGWFKRTLLSGGAELEYEFPQGAPTYYERPPESLPKVGRNDPCPCGSGTKYKRCHGRQD